MAAIGDELPGPAPALGQSRQRPAILLDSEAGQQENDDAQPHVPRHLHHDVADVPGADLSSLQQEEARLHEKNQGAHGEQPQPVDIGFHLTSDPLRKRILTKIAKFLGGATYFLTGGRQEGKFKVFIVAIREGVR